MEITKRFSKSIKILLICAAALFCYSLTLAVLNMNGFGIHDPENTTTFRIILNQVQWVFNWLALWGTIGYLTKDYRAAAGAGVLAIIFSFVSIHAIYLNPTYDIAEKQRIGQFFSIAFIIPYIVFGLMHFKKPKGFYIGLVGLLVWGLNIAHRTIPISDMIDSFAYELSISNPFEIRIAIDEKRSRIIPIFSMIYSNILIILNLIIFWWVYDNLIKNKSFLALNTLSTSSAGKFTYSVLYWVLRLVLFVTGLGIVWYIHREMAGGSLLTSVRLLVCILGIIIIASIYRNFLVGMFVQNEKYPKGLYFFLNMPIINIFAWAYSLFSFKKQTNKPDLVVSYIDQLKKNYVYDGNNPIWKLVIIIFTIISMINLSNKAGFSLEGPNSTNAATLAAIMGVSFCLLIWFLYNYNAFLPLLIICSLNLFVVAVSGIKELLYPAIATNIINIIIFYGLFHFDRLKWYVPAMEAEAETTHQEIIE